jgi:hypothetical protein
MAALVEPLVSGFALILSLSVVQLLVTILKEKFDLNCSIHSRGAGKGYRIGCASYIRAGSMGYVVDNRRHV